ncbi:MAG: sel1 repeat family protein, partial [Rhodobacteraceae bacterium]
MSRLLFFFILFMSTAFLAKADIDDKGVQALLDGDYETAYNELMPLAERGHPRSLYNIAYMHFNGLGLEQNVNEAFKFYEQAAEKGFPMAFHQIGFYFDNGIDRDVNVQEAVKWYEKAAEKGVLISHHNLGFIYDTGRLTGK